MKTEYGWKLSHGGDCKILRGIMPNIAIFARRAQKFTILPLTNRRKI